MKNIKIAIAITAIVGIAALANQQIRGSAIDFIVQKNNKVASGFKEKVYVAVEGSGEIAVMDTATRQVIKRINLAEDKNGMTTSYMPHNVEVAPDNKSVWVTANADDTKMKMSFQFIPRVYADTGHGDENAGVMGTADEVIVIDPFSDSVVKRIELGQGLHLSHVSLTPDSRYAIVASQEKGIIYKIDTASFTVEKRVETKKSGGPHGLRISPDSKTAYIAMLGGKSLGILDLASSNLRDVPLKGAVVQTGVTPDGKYALASVYDAKSLAVYDVASAKLSYVDLPKEAKGPVQIYPTPDSRSVYVADQGFYFDQPIGDTVYKIDLQKMSVTQSIKGGRAPHGVVVSRDGRFTYVTNLKSDDVSIVDTSVEKEVARVPIGKMPNGVSMWYAFGADGRAVVPVKRNYSELVSAEKSFDLGTVSMAKGTVSHLFTIKNVGVATIRINKIYTSCMCTSAILVNGSSRKGPFGMPGMGGPTSVVNETVTPGQEMNIEVSVDPAAHGPQGTGPAKKAVYIETDSATTPTLKLGIDINVTP